MTQTTKIIFTPEEYLAMEERADYKSEFFQGEIFALAGGSANHSTITGNCVTALYNALRSKPSRVFDNNIRLLVNRNGSYTYPDVSVVCGKIEFVAKRNDTITNPVLIVEGMIPATWDYDYVKKFALYKQLDSLREYLLVDYEQIHATLLRRVNNQWIIELYNDINDVLPLESIECEIALRDLYAKVEFENQT